MGSLPIMGLRVQTRKGAGGGGLIGYRGAGAALT